MAKGKGKRKCVCVRNKESGRCKKRKTQKYKHHKKYAERADLPASCIGKVGSDRVNCVKEVCSQRPEPYRTQCLERAKVV